MAQIFISYAHDSLADRVLAQRLHHALVQRNWTVWMDRLFHAGDDIQTIEHELDAAACVVVVWSEAASRSQWVRKEFSRALDQHKAVPVHAGRDGQRPLFAQNSIFIDLHDWNGQAGHHGYEQLLLSVAAKLHDADMLAAETLRAPHPGAPRKPQSPKAAHLTRIRSAAANPALWRTAEFLDSVQAAPASLHGDVARTILDAVGPHRELNELAVLHLANEYLATPNDRKSFFSACGRWPPPRLSANFCLVPDGRYTVGSPPEEPGRCSDEHQQKILLTAFLIAETPVTNAQFLRFNPQHPVREWGGLSKDELQVHPAVRVTWWEAYLYCAWVGGHLPSEAQWEAACRAGSTTAYACGDAIDRRQANFKCGTADTLNRTVPVSSLGPPNAFGLRDMHGNVWEWCMDTYDEDFFVQPPNEDPVCRLPSHYRVSRGGCWNDPPHALRSAFRNRVNPESRMDNNGFRVVFPARR